MLQFIIDLCVQLPCTADIFQYKRIAEELRETLTQGGLIQVELGPTYFADRLNDDRSVFY